MAKKKIIIEESDGHVWVLLGDGPVEVCDLCGHVKSSNPDTVHEPCEGKSPQSQWASFALKLDFGGRGLNFKLA